MINQIIQGHVLVCDSCLRASCAQGIFYCENYKIASFLKKSIEELKKLNLESPSYWFTGTNTYVRR